MTPARFFTKAALHAMLVHTGPPRALGDLTELCRLAAAIGFQCAMEVEQLENPPEPPQPATLLLFKNGGGK